MRSAGELNKCSTTQWEDHVLISSEEMNWPFWRALPKTDWVHLLLNWNADNILLHVPALHATLLKAAPSHPIINSAWATVCNYWKCRGLNRGPTLWVYCICVTAKDKICGVVILYTGGFYYCGSEADKCTHCVVGVFYTQYLSNPLWRLTTAKTLHADFAEFLHRTKRGIICGIEAEPSIGRPSTIPQHHCSRLSVVVLLFNRLLHQQLSWMYPLVDAPLIQMNLNLIQYQH